MRRDRKKTLKKTMAASTFETMKIYLKATTYGRKVGGKFTINRINRSNYPAAAVRKLAARSSLATSLYYSRVKLAQS